MIRKILLGLGTLLLLVVLVGAIWLHRLRTGPAPRTGEVSLEGLSAPVIVLRDDFGIPQIWAESHRDAAFAQGFVTASDRLWQMEMFRRVAEGRLSELFGEELLDTDRFLRTLGMARAAERSAAALDDDARSWLESYIAGVNAAIADPRGARPPEFVLLRLQPEPWTVAQALAVEKIMAWDLAEYSTGLSLAAAEVALGRERLDLVRPADPAWGLTIVDGWPEGGREAWLDGPRLEDLPTEASEASQPVGAAEWEAARERLFASARPPARAVRLLESVSTVRASNSWVVGPERSASGKPLLANDMHLGLDQPTIWYLAGLHAPGLDVVGMTLPGVPGVVAGHTDGVAWGFTNAGLDDADFFVERVDPADTTRYLTPDGSEPFEVRREVIEVRGGEADTLVVRETRHGPIVSPVESRAGDRLLALRWVAHDVSRTQDAILAINRAGSVDEVIEALEDFTNPHQNVVFADTAGRWGYWMAGRVPLRRAGRPSAVPVPGWSGEHDWIGDLPFALHPHALEPEEGFVVTANNRQSADTVAELVAPGTWALPYRAIRIRELLEARESHDARSMHRIQLDVGSAFVERYLPLAVDAFEAAGEASAAELLMTWDGDATLESRAATLFHSWWERLRTARRTALYGEPRGYLPTSAVERALEGGGVTRAMAVAAAEAAAGDEGMPWGEANVLTLGHPMADVPVVGRLLGFGRAGIPRAGGPHSPNVASGAGSRPPFRVSSGPSQRHVVDLADLDGAGGFVLPGGQSGRPASPHTYDQLELWRAGRLVPVPMSRGAVEARARSRLLLTPGS